jgi:hypothetical protein
MIDSGFGAKAIGLSVLPNSRRIDMWRGCLGLIAIYAAALYLEYQQIQALPFAGYVAGALALGITLFVGSLHGLADALRLRARPQTDISQWREGEKIRVSGVLSPIGEPVRAPFSEQAALFCHYSGKARDDEPANASMQPPHWRGMLGTACVLRTPAAKLAVLGLPSLREVPYTVYQGPPYTVRAAQHLANTAWQVAPDIATVAPKQLDRMFTEGFASGPSHLINPAALERLQMQICQSSEAELLARLEAGKWQFSECVVPAGAEVTLVGTYRASPPAIDINYTVGTPDHLLNLGAASQTAARQLASTVTFIVILGGLTAAAHYAVYAQQGQWYRAALQGLGLID